MADIDESTRKLRDKLQIKENNQYVKGAMFLTCVTGMSLVCGFGMTLAMAKKKDPTFFAKGLVRTKHEVDTQSGGDLAMRALGWGTLYAVGGFSAFVLISWKLLGLNNLRELPDKMKNIMPAVPQPVSSGRTEFKSFRELMEYLISQDKIKKGLSDDDSKKK